MLNSKFDLYKTEWLDLVFADRNKTYGAYDLRIHYGDNMLKALAITVVGFTLAAGALTIAFKHDVVETRTTTVNIPEYKLPPIEKPVEPIKRDKLVEAKPQQPAAAAPKSDAATQRHVPPVVMPDELVKTDFKPLDPDKAISNVDSKGLSDKSAVNAVPGVQGGTGEATVGPPASTGEDKTIYEGVDVMPEPVGGNAAWAKFLQKNLHYPDTEVQGRVIISFIIEKDGHLTDLKVIKGVATELDREAMRVLKLAPAWNPGLQNGKPVRVKYTIPIVFQISE
ncbi:energy transducer TonB [Mucilaginibacter terrae]|uniref:energy transducer TonB n=1 Tax=Mucilaginibacter terrae TaxID=1955052 RepID=UPI0036330A3B